MTRPAGRLLLQFGAAGDDVGGGRRRCARWIEQHGVPQTLYTDWKNVYVRRPTEAERCGGEPRR